MVKTPAPPALELIRVAAGPGLVLAGFGVIPAFFWWGVFLVYLGILVCLAEAIWDPWLLKGPETSQVSIIGLVFASASLFTIAVVLRANPLYVGYRITDTKLVELHIRNDSEQDDYQDMDLTMCMDAKNAFFDKVRNLNDFPYLTVVGPEWKLSHEEEALFYSDGTSWRMISQTLRVRCSILPKHSSIDALLSIVRGSGPSAIVPSMDWQNLTATGTFKGKFRNVTISTTAIREK